MEKLIDLGYGEPHLVRSIFRKYFPNNQINLRSIPSHWEYTKNNGFPDLVSLLEKKHNCPIVVTTGAKQALGACFYALKSFGHVNLGLKLPYWNLVPPLIEFHGLNSVPADYEEYSKFTSYLFVAPNNPDGYLIKQDLIASIVKEYRDRDIPLIHDGAYWSPNYLPENYAPFNFGDMQIFSFGKMFGLTGMRLGYIAVHNEKFLSKILEYMELTTANVSVASQIYVSEILEEIYYNPEKAKKFFSECREELNKNKKLINFVIPGLLSGTSGSAGMFGWYKKSPRLNFEDIHVKVIDGAGFGDPDRVRLNLGVMPETLKEAVERFNSV